MQPFAGAQFPLDSANQCRYNNARCLTAAIVGGALFGSGKGSGAALCLTAGQKLKKYSFSEP